MPKEKKTEFIVKTVQDFYDLQEHINSTLHIYIVQNLDFKAFTVKIEAYKEKRSNPQNSFFWASCTEIADYLNKKGFAILKMGEQCHWTKDDVAEVNKTKFGTASTSKLSKKEFCDFMENTFAFWIEKTKGEWQPLETIDNFNNNEERNV